MNIGRQQDLREFNGDLWEVEARQRASRAFQQAVEVTAAVGALTGLNALAYYVFRQAEFDLLGADLTIASEFLAEWTRFEVLGQSKLKSMAIEVYPWSVREIIRKLVAVNAMGAEDMAMVEEALRTRDVLVHARAQVDAAQLTRTTDRLRVLATRLDSK